MTYNEAKEIIINNQMTYNDFANYFNISTSNAIKIFQHLDLKKCSKGDNCLNSDGPVQSRKNFYSDKSRYDKIDNQCIYCKKQRDHQKYQNNSEYFKQQYHQYYHNNNEYCKQVKRQYQQDNKKYCNQKSRQYQQDNKKYCNQKLREYNNSYAKFDVYNNQISYAEKIQRDSSDSELLQVKCTYCNSWFNPINKKVRDRINALEGRYSLGTENRLYCSDECKQSCPIYGQREYSKDNPRYINNLGTSREVQSELRQLVFERDNWTCQKCSTHKDNFSAGISLHCHHIEGIKHEPIKSADIDMCITVCSECHRWIHKIPGCTRQDMQCND